MLASFVSTCVKELMLVIYFKKIKYMHEKEVHLRDWKNVFIMKVMTIQVEYFHQMKEKLKNDQGKKKKKLSVFLIGMTTEQEMKTIFVMVVVEGEGTEDCTLN